MTVFGAAAPNLILRKGIGRDEVNKLHVRWWIGQSFEGGNQSSGRRASGADKDALARFNGQKRLLSVLHLVGVLRF